MSDDSGFQALGDQFAKWFDDQYEALRSLADQPAEPAPLSGIPEALGGTKPVGRFSLTRSTELSPLDALFLGDVSDWKPTGILPDARKLSAIVQVPDELLMDLGAIPVTRPPRPPLPWRWRLRNRIAGWREKLAYRAFKAIAGYDAHDHYAGDE